MAAISLFLILLCGLGGGHEGMAAKRRHRASQIGGGQLLSYLPR